MPFGEVRRVGGDFVGDDAGLYIFAVGAAQVFFGPQDFPIGSFRILSAMDYRLVSADS